MNEGRLDIMSAMARGGIPAVLIFAVVLTAARSACLGAIHHLEGKTIRAIEYVPARQPLLDQEMAQAIPLQPGSPLILDQVRAAIQALYATGRFQDVVIDASETDGGVVLKISTRARWFVGTVQVEGVSEPPNQGQLVSATNLVLGREFREEDLAESVRSLEEKLRANGYYDCRIDPVVEYKEATGQALIRFQVARRDRSRYSHPEVRGVPPPEARTVVGKTGWQRVWGLLGWREVTETRTIQALERIRRFYAGRDYLLSQAELKDALYLEEANRVRHVLEVRRGPKVRIQVLGAKLSRGKLRDLVPVYLEQTVDRDLLAEGLRNINAHFQGQGYFRAKVRMETANSAGGGEVVTYKVELGRKYKLVRLEIRGNEFFDAQTIRERMSLTPATSIRYRQGRFSEEMLAADVLNIEELYRSNGFLDVKVLPRVVEDFGGKPGELAVYIDITPGSPWLVSNLTITGISEQREAELRGRLSSLEGQPYSEANVVLDRDQILTYYYNLGYPSVNLDWKVEPAAQPRQVNVEFVIGEGEPRFLRGFLVSGLKASDPGMIEERLQLSPGESLSQRRLLDSQRKLYDLVVFARVDMALQNPEGEEDSKYVLLQLEEARRYSLNFGFGAEIARIGGGTTTFDAPAGAPGFSPRFSLGITRANMFGVGHTAGVQGRISNIQQRAQLAYLAPQFKGSENLALTVGGLFDLSKDIRTYTSRRLEGSAQLSQRFRRGYTVQERFAWRRTQISDLKIDPSLIPVYSHPAQVGIVSGSFIQERRDDPVDSTRGHYTTVDFGVANKVFGSQSDFTRLLTRNSSYHRLAPHLVLARSVIFGWQQNFGQTRFIEGIPLPERFYSGGSSSHRGFPENQAGPRDLSTGFPIGGSALLMHNLELRFPLLGDNLGAVLFHDLGNVYASLGDISVRYKQKDLQDFSYAVQALGVGFRYRTPVGPLRLDLAYAPNSPSFFGYEGTLEDLIAGTGRQVVQRISRFQFHFSLGQTF